MVIYYDTKTGNVKRFVDQLAALLPRAEFININDHEHFDLPGHLITYTWARGTMPVTTQYFVERFPELVLSASSSGNRNWGETFGMAAELIAQKTGCPILHKFELSGFAQDVNIVADKVKAMQNRNRQKSEMKISI